MLSTALLLLLATLSSAAHVRREASAEAEAQAEAGPDAYGYLSGEILPLRPWKKLS